MNDKKIKIKITDDCQIFAKTVGVKGQDCLAYIELLEQLLDAETVDSNYTEEYYQTEIQSFRQNKQFLKGGD
ncbi:MULTISPECIES: DUF2997 domain-containing protein [Virgibacillus]|uniref:DUF2997 domain-containing protein n=1 Tax=Virgibacillus pantothenticus TaxID=1473 RepID=A0A0L0QVN5_VIRPA|nr:MULTISPECIES: DUF2997 domain-containing protein [Virgibacillus]API92533.1 hypothetical protein BKP57_12385 [Virgibacillus sp. 6R]KNE22278.1 hypothetical protein AFK71_01170 [Virgibacillus pantothenticus]MBS7428012.1 DUF2997 domain-containing protein [Virgibacillus sp. 19R1-5]MBU8568580.1 DUF2997 domain-containing protein [Virgibacillus pantothenticus]MBU8602592.1 DUF2997 domain-containing protein [Virgibacillus pantothenticus]